jgi:hypothetical protein
METETMHPFALRLTIAAAFTLAVLALMLAHEYTEHRKRKAAAAEAMMARAIETAFVNAARRRAAERQAEAQRAAERAQLDAIAEAYYTRSR